MIATFTPNPSMDRTLEVDEFVRGGVIRANSFRLDPGGKGVNVARVLSSAGVPTLAIFPCGADDLDFVHLLEAAGVPCTVVSISGRIRQNISILEPEGVITHLNEPGPRLTSSEVLALLDTVSNAARRADWICASGSLPPGQDPGLYQEVARLARLHGCKVGVDTSGEPLARAVAGGVDLIKPNRHELEEAVAGEVTTVGDAVEAAFALNRAGSRAVLASLGSDGAILVEEGVAWHAEARVDEVVSNVGAGDALLAGFLAAGGSGVAALAEGIAWAAAKISLPGSQMPRSEQIERSLVRVSLEPDKSRKLKED
ncbi:MAG: 1-phosphofructokinase family hexose kinase [Actinomycetota bacterium]|nr:1-phosphofructokinase family hexose kinase [Actinomycetota bacterium]